MTVPRAAWRSGVNHLELRFAYDARPSDAGIPDGRSLAASVDAIVRRASLPASAPAARRPRPVPNRHRVRNLGTPTFI